MSAEIFLTSTSPNMYNVQQQKWEQQLLLQQNNLKIIVFWPYRN